MNVTGIQAKIYDEEKCVYEYETAGSKENDLQTLLQNLRDMQSEVNNFLTTLIQRQNTSGRAQKTTEQSISSDVESDFNEEEVEEEEEEEEEETAAVKEKEEEAQVNPKKCKLSI